jgi:hypothetical protein
VSEKGAELIRRAERGGRVEQVRMALGMNGDAFANAINALGDERGYDPRYDKSKVSRLEGGNMIYLPAEEAVLIALLDPEKRGVEWLVFGKRAAKATGAPKYQGKQPTSRTAQHRRTGTDDR